MLYVAFFLLPALVYAQLPDSVWSRVYGGEHNQRCVAAVQTADGGYALAGNYDYGERVSDFLLVRVDANGDTLWTRTYGGDSLDICTSMLASGGSFYLAGSTGSEFNSGDDAYLFKVDSVGDVVWPYVEDFGPDDVYTCLAPTHGPEILVGYSTSNTEHTFLEALRFAPTGHTTWSWTTTGGRGSEFIALFDLDNDELMAAGSYHAADSTDADFMLLRFNANSTVAWRRTYGGPYDDRCTSAIQTSDGGYLLAGWTQSFGQGDFDYWLLKLSADGDSLWSHTYGGAYWDQCTSVVETPTGYLLAGKREDNNDGNFQLWIVATDFLGEQPQTTYFGGTDDEAGAVIVPTSDHGFAFAGATRSFGSLGWNLWLLKTVYLPHIAVDRPSITFGGVHLGDSTSRTLNILNIGGVPATLTALEFPPDFHTSLQFPLDLAPGAHLETPIVFAPQQVGTYIDTLVIHSNSVTDPGPVRLVGSGLAVSAAESGVKMPTQFALLGNYPNPFNARTRIDYALPASAPIELTLYNVNGARIATLVSGLQPAGIQHYDFAVAGLASGIYLYRLSTPSASFTRKLMLLK